MATGYIPTLRCSYKEFIKEDGSLDFKKAYEMLQSEYKGRRVILKFLDASREWNINFWKKYYNYTKWNIPEVKERRHQLAVSLWKERKEQKKRARRAKRWEAIKRVLWPISIIGAILLSNILFS